MTHVPYRGAGPALTDLMAGTVQVIFDNMPSSIGAHQGRQAARARGHDRQALAGAARTCRRVAETVPGYEASAWFGMGAPKGTPPDVIAKLNKAVNDGARRSEDAGAARRARRRADGAARRRISARSSSTETAKWKKVVEFSGASVE